MFKVAIIGGENTENYQYFEYKCINMLRNKAEKKERIIIYTVGDEYVSKFTKKFGIETITIPCNWKLNGKHALNICVDEITNNIDAIIIFDDGKSNTRHFLDISKKKNLLIRKINKDS